MQTIPARTLRWFFLDVVGEFVVAPIWWYSNGIIAMLRFVLRKLAEHEEKLGLRMWARSLLLPMYAQRDWQGRLISFCVRCVFLVIKTFIFLLWVVWYGILVLLYLIMPLIIVWQIIFQVTALL